MSTLVKGEESNVDINLVAELEGTLNDLTVIGQEKKTVLSPHSGYHEVNELEQS